MKLSLKLALFAFVAIAVAGAEGAVEVLAPHVRKKPPCRNSMTRRTPHVRCGFTRGPDPR